MFFSGEACGEGTLVTLAQRFREKGIAYRCYDVYDDPRSSTQLPALTECAMDIIDSVQTGKTREGACVYLALCKRKWPGECCSFG